MDIQKQGILPKNFSVNEKYSVLLFIKKGSNAETYRVKGKDGKPDDHCDITDKNYCSLKTIELLVDNGIDSSTLILFGSIPVLKALILDSLS